MRKQGKLSSHIITLYNVCSVHQGMFSTLGGYNENAGGYHEYISTSDTMSTSGGYHESRGGAN